jgi:RND family efflux transporter MFP subunit
MPEIPYTASRQSSRLRVRGLVAATAALTAAVSCSAPDTTVRAEKAARAVPVAGVTRRDLDRTLELAAEFRPYQEIDLHAKVAGYLKAIYVDVGDHVEKGQLLAELDAPEMTQEAAQADAAFRRAQLDVDRTRAELQRAEAQQRLRQVAYDRLSAVEKARPHLVAQQDLDDAGGRMQEADAQLSAAKVAVASAEEQVRAASAGEDRTNTLLTYLKIVAPFSGTITNRFADPGAMIQAGTASHLQAMPVVQLSQVDRLRLVLPVPESVVPRIRLNAPVEIRVEALKRVFEGQVSRFTGKLDSATRTMETEVDLTNPEQVIKAGMFGSATIVLERRQEALSIPVQALASRSTPIKLLVVGPDHKLEERQVDIGLETADRIEVLSGVREGELVVVGARSDLRAGLEVDPKPQAPAVVNGAR